MARRLRLQFPGAIYHVLNRGDRRELIFRDDGDRSRFVETMEEACAKTGWKVHAFVLMPNHFHLVIETPMANLAAGMKWLLGTYTGRFNRRHGEAGHLFSGRYKALLVGGKGGYLRTVVDYVHLNPVRAKLLGDAVAVRAFRWSSFPLFLTDPAKRPEWLRVDAMLGECGIPKDSPAGRGEFERRLEARRMHESDAEFHPVRHGWFLGDEQFRSELLERTQKRTGSNHYGPDIHESEEQKAERILDSDMNRFGWAWKDLAAKPKGDPAKVRMAERLRRETTMTLHWIAAKLHMGTKGHLSHLLYWSRRGMKPSKRAATGKLPKGRLGVRKGKMGSDVSNPSIGENTGRTSNIPPQAPEPSIAPFAFDTSFD